MLFGNVNLSKLVKYLRVERYLAAKIGTISWWVVFITLVSWFYCSAGFLLFFNKCFHQIGMIAS
jgi:hypothetical protein